MTNTVRSLVLVLVGVVSIIISACTHGSVGSVSAGLGRSNLLPSVEGTPPPSIASRADRALQATMPNTYPAVVIASSPAAYYRLDDTGTIALDRSGNGLNMNIGTAVMTGAPGLVPGDSAVSLLGIPRRAADVITSSRRNSLLEPSKAVSVEAWIKPKTLPAIHKQEIASYGSSAAGLPYGLHVTSTGVISWHVEVNGSDRAVYSTKALVVGKTYHAIGTYDGSTLSLYLNGLLEASLKAVGSITGYDHSPFGATIGEDGSLMDGAFNGTVDEVAFYRHSLLATDASKHYLAANPSPNPSANNVYLLGQFEVQETNGLAADPNSAWYKALNGTNPWIILITTNGPATYPASAFAPTSWGNNVKYLYRWISEAQMEADLATPAPGHTPGPNYPPAYVTACMYDNEPATAPTSPPLERDDPPTFYTKAAAACHKAGRTFIATAGLSGGDGNSPWCYANPTPNGGSCALPFATQAAAHAAERCAIWATSPNWDGWDAQDQTAIGVTSSFVSGNQLHISNLLSGPGGACSFTGDPNPVSISIGVGNFDPSLPIQHVTIAQQEAAIQTIPKQYPLWGNWGPHACTSNGPSDICPITGAVGLSDEEQVIAANVTRPTVWPSPGPTPTATPNTIYFGARVNPNGNGGSPADTATFETQIGRKLALDMSYERWSDTTWPGATQTDDVTNGRIPVMSLNCGDFSHNVAIGNDDAVIDAMATRIKAFGSQIWLRYFWEMNLDDGANGRTQCYDAARDSSTFFFNPTDFIEAWKHFHDRLNITDGVTNVTWVWCPSDGGVSNPYGQPSSTLYYPGASYVDWNCFDAYARGATTTPTSTYANMYALLQPLGLPIVIGENGALPGNQIAYFGANVAALKADSLIRGYMYFDANGTTSDWRITDLPSFATMANDPYLSR